MHYWPTSMSRIFSWVRYNCTFPFVSECKYTHIVVSWIENTSLKLSFRVIIYEGFCNNLTHIKHETNLESWLASSSSRRNVAFSADGLGHHIALAYHILRHSLLDLSVTDSIHSWFLGVIRRCFSDYKTKDERTLLMHMMPFSTRFRGSRTSSTSISTVFYSILNNQGQVVIVYWSLVVLKSTIGLVWKAKAFVVIASSCCRVIFLGVVVSFAVWGIAWATWL